MNIDYPEHLLPYQRTTVERVLKFFKSNPARCAYIGDEQGLGKTISSIAIMDILEATKVLLVVPATVMYSWESEINTWSQYEHEVFVGHKSILFTTSKQHVLDASVVIVSHDMIRNDAVHAVLMGIPFDLLIVDEAHKVKSRSSKRAIRLLGTTDRRFKNPPPCLWDAAQYRIALSGTPLPDSVTNCFVWFRRMAEDIFTNYYEFADTFSNKIQDKWGVKYKGTRNEPLLHKTITDRFFTRFKKADVMKDLPDKIFNQVILPKSLSKKVQMKEELEKEILSILEGTEDQDKISSLIRLEPVAQYRREQGLMKVDVVSEFVADLLDDGVPVILFAYHISVIEALQQKLIRFNPVTVVGSTSPKKRHRAQEAFQSGETNLFIGNILAAGVGLNLFRSSTVVFAEDDWSPGNMAQAVDRAHRKGQKSVVNVYNFCVKGSIDQDVQKILREKMKAHAAVIDGDKNAVILKPNKINYEEVVS